MSVGLWLNWPTRTRDFELRTGESKANPNHRSSQQRRSAGPRPSIRQRTSLRLGSQTRAAQNPANTRAFSRRILQNANGYLGTWVNGVRTRANDADTGARPGRLARPTVA